MGARNTSSGKSRRSTRGKLVGTGGVIAEPKRTESELATPRMEVEPHLGNAELS